MIKFNNAAVALATAILRDYLNGTVNFFASRKAAKSELTKLTPADFKNVRVYRRKRRRAIRNPARYPNCRAPQAAKRPPRRHLHRRKRRRTRANRKGKRAAKKEIYQKQVA